MRSSCRYTFLTDFRQRQQRLSSTAILPPEDDTLTINKLFTNLHEQINFRTLAGFRHKTKQSKTNRKKRLIDNDDSSYNDNSNNKDNSNNNSNNNDYNYYNNNNNNYSSNNNIMNIGSYTKTTNNDNIAVLEPSITC